MCIYTIYVFVWIVCEFLITVGYINTVKIRNCDQMFSYISCCILCTWILFLKVSSSNQSITRLQLCIGENPVGYLKKNNILVLTDSLTKKTKVLLHFKTDWLAMYLVTITTEMIEKAEYHYEQI